MFFMLLTFLQAAMSLSREAWLLFLLGVRRNLIGREAEKGEGWVSQPSKERCRACFQDYPY